MFKGHSMIIAVDGKRLKTLSFVLRARDGKASYRESMKGFMIKDGAMYATDGKRLHVAKECPIDAPEGCYSVTSFKGKVLSYEPIGDCTEFPEVSRVVPVLTAESSCGVFAGSSIDTHHSLEVFRLVHLFPAPAMLSLSFLSDLDDHTYTVHFFDPKKGIVFDSKERMAIIMPISLD
jgi:hypothetical protein